MKLKIGWKSLQQQQKQTNKKQSNYHLVTDQEIDWNSIQHWTRYFVNSFVHCNCIQFINRLSKFAHGDLFQKIRFLFYSIYRIAALNSIIILCSTFKVDIDKMLIRMLGWYRHATPSLLSHRILMVKNASRYFLWIMGTCSAIGFIPVLDKRYFIQITAIWKDSLCILYCFLKEISIFPWAKRTVSTVLFVKWNMNYKIRGQRNNTKWFWVSLKHRPIFASVSLQRKKNASDVGNSRTNSIDCKVCYDKNSLSALKTSL